jgi:hypothetical protein
MNIKKCFKCLEIKPLSEYYKHPKTADGHLGKCKKCAKMDTNERRKRGLNDPEWVELVKKRKREGNRRIDRKKPTHEQVSTAKRKSKERYPEKYKALNASQRMLKDPGNNLHHWSYNQEHWKDVIELSRKDHMKAHRFMVYDQERMMYRRYDTNELLDTRERHEIFIFDCIKNKPD